MRRREFMKLVCGTVTWPIGVHAQQPAMPVIGFVHSASFEPRGHWVAEFHRGLLEAGYVDGHKVTIEYRWAEGRQDRFFRARG